MSITLPYLYKKNKKKSSIKKQKIKKDTNYKFY